jgi:hypothetical protein
MTYDYVSTRCQNLSAERFAYPTPHMLGHIYENHVVSTPESSAKAGKSDSQSKNNTQWDKVTQCFGLKEARERITLHGLEDVVFRAVEYFGVISSFLFNGSDDSVQSRIWENDLTLAAREYKGIQNFLSGGANVGTGDSMTWGV